MHILKIVTHFGFIVIGKFVYAIIFSAYCVLVIFLEKFPVCLCTFENTWVSKVFLAETSLLYCSVLAATFTPHSAALPASDSSVTC